MWGVSDKVTFVLPYVHSHSAPCSHGCLGPGRGKKPVGVWPLTVILELTDGWYSGWETLLV